MVTYIVGSLSAPIVVLGRVKQMNRLRQVMRPMVVYLSTSSLGIIVKLNFWAIVNGVKDKVGYEIVFDVVAIGLS